MQDIVRQPLDMWFAHKGFPLWDQAKRKGSSKRTA
jgi:hypothetical protein